MGQVVVIAVGVGVLAIGYVRWSRPVDPTTAAAWRLRGPYNERPETFAERLIRRMDAVVSVAIGLVLVVGGVAQVLASAF